MKTRFQSFQRTGLAAWGMVWLILCVTAGAFLLAQPGNITSINRSSRQVINAAMTSSDGKLYANIEALRVGQRVITPGTDPAHPMPTAVDPSTWKQVTLRRQLPVDRDVVDVMSVETLQPLEWLTKFAVREGGTAPAPIDLEEMGVQPGDFQVVKIAPCPSISQSPGRVVLTTVTHLNDYLFDLSVRNNHSKQQLVQVTGLHKVFSQRRGWTSVGQLEVGEPLQGRAGSLQVASLVRRPGMVPVYNLTVEDEHVYYVSTLKLLAHNTECGGVNSGPNEPTAPTEEPVNAGDLRKLKDGRLEKMGVDAHALKQDVVGKSNISKYNVSQGPGGKVYLTPVQKGSTPFVETPYTFDQLPDIFPTGE